MEALLFGGDKLVVHICFLFNMFLKFGFLPKNFMSSVIVPLVTMQKWRSHSCQ
jgi:hypothetical protein